jgi:hypothetical protein
MYVFKEQPTGSPQERRERDEGRGRERLCMRSCARVCAHVFKDDGCTKDGACLKQKRYDVFPKIPTPK